MALVPVSLSFPAVTGGEWILSRSLLVQRGPGGHRLSRRQTTTSVQGLSNIRNKFRSTHRYIVTVVEDHSRFKYVSPMWSTVEASYVVLRFIKRFEKQPDLTVTGFHMDGSSEFLEVRYQLDNDVVDIFWTTVYTN